jgi:hypothetical protein
MSHPHQFFAQMYTTQHHHPQQQPLIPLPAPHHVHPQPQDPSYAGEPSSSTAGGVERKRPKYTRSKTGCMTCRHKKIKCDERKPICSRCSHGQRECTWPEGLPKKKAAAEAKRKRNTSEEGDEDSPTNRRSNSPPSTAGSINTTNEAQGTAAFNGLLSPTSPRHPYTTSSYATGNAAAVAAAANFGTYRQPLPSPQYPPTPISGGSHFSSAAGFPPTPVSAQFRGGAPPNSAAAVVAAATRGSRSGSAASTGGLSAFDPTLLALPSLSGASPYSSSNHTPNASYTGSPNPSEDYHSGGEASASYSSDTAYSSGASAGGGGAGTGPGGAGTGSGGPGSAVEKLYLPGEKLYYTGEKEKYWNANGGSTMFTSPDPIEPYFRTVQERNLVGTRSFF